MVTYGVVNPDARGRRRWTNFHLEIRQGAFIGSFLEVQFQSSGRERGYLHFVKLKSFVD